MLEGSILQQLSDAHKTGPRPLRFGVYYKNTLVALCHALEDSILSSNCSPIVITAFQRGKWYLQEAERYREIAAKSRQIAIMAAPDSGFAEHPTSKLPNVDLVSLAPVDPVAQEWHLMILSPTYTAMVICQELDPADYGAAGQPEADLERKFYGFWTFEPALVWETVELAKSHIGKYNPELEEKLTAQLKAMLSEGNQQPEDLGAIVSRVVDYLQTSHEDLIEDKHAEIPASHHEVLDINLVSNELQAFVRMAQLMELANTGNPMSTAEVAALAETMGQILDLPAWQLKRLRLAGLLHGLVPSLTPATSSPEEAPSCPLVPEIQALRAMPQLKAIASIITHFTEWWNGSGSPAGLAYDSIPLESRILGLVTDFQWRVSQYKASQNSRAESLSQALAECQALAGERWDPKLIEALTLLVKGLQQGLNLSVTPPKVSTGMWLFDDHQESNLISH
ncbi:MAG TPA: metal-dependent phosphohydrolase [Cyanobacteria bacterium UBA11369]|nr:metal-dependent phosphohydrolase [Cyanobacteria bacterium UBA11371]HBE54248.1 metal-dependent phosphohydrolase [Cyanobacteria bacterium UBA11369]